MTLDELLLELRDVVLDASPEDFEAMKLRYDELHRELRDRIVKTVGGAGVVLEELDGPKGFMCSEPDWGSKRGRDDHEDDG